MESRESLEYLRLLNPAFSGLLVLRGAAGYAKETEKNFPFIYSYLILPFVLHAETRERIPGTIITKLATWSERNADLVAGFAKRARELAPATRDGIFLLSSAGALTFGDAGALNVQLKESSSSKFLNDVGLAEAGECAKKATFVGRWLATSGTVPTVLSSLGVLP